MIPVTHQKRNNTDADCASLMPAAEQELAAFFHAVKKLFGLEQAQLSAEDWLKELTATRDLPASSHEWRSITIHAATRLASRVSASLLSREPQLSSNRACVCS